tara:strand:- start:15722 stop:16312 length:591 start_codon:yes stop_codon:yes gene_type:complete
MHSDNPQLRLINQATEALRQGDLIVYPTDSTYAFGCALSSSAAVNTIRKLRGLTDKHPLTLICHNISQASEYAVINNKAFSFIKSNAPGPYTFILKATKIVPRLALGVKRKVVGIRIPDSGIPLALTKSLGEPILSATLWLEGNDQPITDPHEIEKDILRRIKYVLDGGTRGNEMTTILDFTQDEPALIRQGIGQV